MADLGDGSPSGWLLAMLALASFVPPILLVIGIRNLERHRKEPYRLLFLLMGFGATLGVLVALALTNLADRTFPPETQILGFAPLVFATVFLAPPIEELSKGLSLLVGRKSIFEPEDGLIHGAAIGLGFAATENFAYALLNYNSYGLKVALATVLLRVASSTILHAGTTALLGFGFSLVRLRMAPRITLAALYVVAFLQHALYNGLVIADGRSEVIHDIGFAVGILLVIGNAGVLTYLITHYDRIGVPVPQAPPKDARLLRWR